MKKNAFSLVFILLLAVLACSCAANNKETEYAKVNAFLKKVDEGNYKNAIEYYESNIAGNYILESEADEHLALRIDNAVADYNNGTNSYSDAERIIGTISRLEILQESQINSGLKRLDMLEQSKATYASAILAMDNKEWKDAYRLLLQVSVEDTFYADSMDKLKEVKSSVLNDLFSRAEDFCKENDFRSAIMLFIRPDNLSDTMASAYAEELAIKKNEIASTYLTYITEQMRFYASTDSYERALDFLVDEDDKNEDILGLIPYELFEEVNQVGLEMLQGYTTQIISEANALCDNGEYDLAMQHLLEDGYKYEPTDELYDAECQIRDRYILQVIAEANDMCDNGEYKVALQHIVENGYKFGTNQDLPDALNRIEELYEDDILMRAEEAFGVNKDYESAINTLLEDGPVNSERLYSAIEHYREYIPFYLTDLDNTKKAQYIQIGVDSWEDDVYTDVNGNIYESSAVICPLGFYLASQHAESDDEAFVEYNLGYQYSTLTGVVFRPYQTLSCPQMYSNATRVRIYGDDILLFESPDFSSDTYNPVSFNLDISNVRTLKIIVRGVWWDNNYGIYTYYPLICVGEMMLQK